MIEGIKILKKVCERKLKTYNDMYCALSHSDTNYKQYKKLENELVEMMLYGYKNYTERQLIEQQKETEKQIEEFIKLNLFSGKITE